MSDKKTCGDCPWGGSPAVLELEGGTRVDVWQWCQIGREGAGLLIKEHPECQFRKAYRVLRDEVRRLRMDNKLQRVLIESMIEFLEKPKPNPKEG